MRSLGVLAAGMLLLWLPASSAAAPKMPQATGNCFAYVGHVFEACFAYKVNDSGLALRNYYAYVHSADLSRASDAHEDFLYRYRSAARQLVTSRVSSWPIGENVVATPVIEILSATASLVTNTASITTRETWRVTTASGRGLYLEQNHLHHISMARVQGKLLHIWVVTAIR